MKKSIIILITAVSLLSQTREYYLVDSKNNVALENVEVTYGGLKTLSDVRGRIEIDTSDEYALFKLAGYKKEYLTLDPMNNIIQLSRFKPKALYMSFWAAGSSKYRDRIYSQLEANELNALVIDMKNDYGDLMFKPSNQTALKAKAFYNRTVKDIHSFIQELKERGIYLIARVVIFKDKRLVEARSDLAIRDKKDQIWINNEGLNWSDPFLNEVQTYNIDLAKEIAILGFDEIQFDYIRFPEKDGLKFSKDNNENNRVSAIASFLKKAKDELSPYNVFISADVFGYICWSDGSDIGIGQKIENIIKYVDYIAPMLYPSGFETGLPGIVDNPVAEPGKIVELSLKKMIEEYDVPPNKIRPWLQAFKDYTFDKRKFGKIEIMNQIDAAELLQTNGWMIWHPASWYNEEVFALIENIDKFADR